MRLVLPFLAFPAFLAFLAFPASLAFPSDEPFIGPANWGGTGLMEIPTARILKENTYRIGAAQVYPYRLYYGAVSPLKGIEIDGRVTEIIGVSASANNPTFQGYGNYKDKALDFKFRFLEETKYGPALALGIMDPQGTRLYPSQYIVASKQIYPFDFTIGFGNGRFGKKPLPPSNNTVEVEMFSDPGTWLRDGQAFGGIQFAPSDKYSLMVEYSPIKYQKQTSDPAQAEYFQRPVPSKFNYGLRWKPFPWAEVDLTYQRGEEVGLNLSTAFELGRPLIPIYDSPYREKKESKRDPLTGRLVRALSQSGFSSIGVSVEENGIWIQAQNDKYFYTTQALWVLLAILAEITPPGAGDIRITLTANGIPVLDFSTTREDIAEWYGERLTKKELVYLSKITTEGTEKPDAPVFHRNFYSYGWKPSFETYVNDPSGFFKYRLGVAAWGSYHPWAGTSLVLSPEVYPLNDISTSIPPTRDAVRSDIVLYTEKKAALGRLMFDQVYKMEHEVYGHLSAGLLEIQYAGFDGEIAKPLWGGRLMVGVGGSLVKKRDPDNPLKLSDEYTETYKTAFFNTRLNIPERDLSVDVRSGRFLGGDVGARFTVSKFINGVIISAWYSVTGTSVFNQPFNRGYHDKGISIVIPIRLFTGSDSRTSYYYSVSPWTRDVAQDIDHFNPLFDFIGRNLKAFFDRDWKRAD
jgi:hypothetical protein